MVLHIVSALVVFGAGYYVGGKVSVASVKAELVKIEAEAVADVKAVVARVKAAL